MQSNALPTTPSNTKPSRKTTWDNGWLLVAAVVALILLLVFGQPDPYKRVLVFVSDGVVVTITMTLISFALVLVIGLLVALARMSRLKLLSGLMTVYVDVIRGIPVLVQLFFWYFAFPSILIQLGTSLHSPALTGYKANPNVMAIMGLTICYAAYMSEVYRAGIQSIHKGQMEAARSLGMNYFQSMRYVILPQAVRVILPPVGNEFITLLKDTSLVSVVSVSDMVRRGREFMAANFISIQPWIMVSLLYLIMTLLASRLINYLERRTRLEK